MRGGGDNVLRHTDIGQTGRVCRLPLHPICVGNLIGSALAKPLTDWKCKVSVFCWTNALLAVIQRGDVLLNTDAPRSYVRLYLWQLAYCTS